MKIFKLFYQRLKLWQFGIIITIIPFLILISNAWNNSITADEAVHFTAGYSYVVLGEYRLNPEHPPLLKIFSGLSILSWSMISGREIKFNTESVFWKDIINAQVPMSFEFISSNKSYIKEIVFWSRIPTIVLFIMFGWYILYSIHDYSKSKLTSMFIGVLYFFSINLLAHSNLVTTDLISSFAFLITIDRFVRYLFNTNYSNLLKFSFVILLAVLSKFSLVILFPIFLISSLIVIFIRNKNNFIKSYLSLMKDTLILVIISILGISLVYWFCMRNMPIGIGSAIIHQSLVSDNYLVSLSKVILLKLSDITPFRYLVQYLVGQIMVFLRVSNGNPTYLLGETIMGSFKSYFPLTYIFKESIFIIISVLIILIYKLIYLFKHFNSSFIFKFNELFLYKALISTIIVWYWIIVLIGNLNLGIRHILPILVLTYIWVGLNLIPLVKKFNMGLALFVGTIYYVGVALWTYPNYLSYINPIGLSFESPYNIFVDSNLDWGQDLKRLKIWIDDNDIQEIYIDYFGGDNMYNYFDHNDFRVRPYVLDNGEIRNTYLAVSATQYQLKYKLELNKENQEYGILANKRPIKIIGGSILIFEL